MTLRPVAESQSCSVGQSSLQCEGRSSSTHTDQTVDQAGVEMLLAAPLERTAGVGGVHVAQDVGQGYEGDEEGEEEEIIQQGGSS